MSEQLGGAEAVGDHDVGLREGLAAAHGHEPRVAGTGANEDHAAIGWARAAQVDGPGVDVVGDGVAHGANADRIRGVRGDHANGEVPVG